MHWITIFIRTRKASRTSDMTDDSMNAKFVKTIADDVNAVHGTGRLVVVAANINTNQK